MSEWFYIRLAFGLTWAVLAGYTWLLVRRSRAAAAGSMIPWMLAATPAEEDIRLLGPDIVGLSTDFDTARKVFDAWREPLDKRLQERHNAKLLATYPFGPQILFCKPAVGGL